MSLVDDLFWFIFFLGTALQLPRFFLTGAQDKYRVSLKQLIIYHFILGAAFYVLTRNGGGDSWAYWTTAKEMDIDHFKEFLFEGEGTRFMEAFNYIPANVLGMSFFSNTMFYSLLGNIGVCCFFMVALETIPFNKLLYGYAVFPLVFFLPNLHFWSAGVGKDTMLFMSVGMFAYGLLKPLKRFPLIAVSLLLSMAIRPHITLFLLVGFGLAYIFGGKISTIKRIGFSLVLLGAGIAILPQVLEFIKVDSFTVDALSQRAEIQVGNLSKGSGSSVDTSSYPFPLKIFTYLYRPLFFDARSIGGLISSFDNLVLLLLTWQALRYRPLETFRLAPFVVKGFLLFGILGTLAFSTSLGNLGIMIRMKNMFTPGILIYFMWCYSYRAYQAYIQDNKMRPGVKGAEVHK